MEFAEFIKIPKLDGVTLTLPFKDPVEGTLCITGHHSFLSSRKTMREELWLLHSAVDSVEKKLSGSNGGTILLKCKDLKVVQLDIPTAEDCLSIAHSIEQLSNVAGGGMCDTGGYDVKLSYPFFYRANFDILENGWHAFLPDTEINRLIGASQDWRISYVNKDFQVCGSYPAAVVVPKSIDDEVIVKVATFRHLGRFPVLSYYHKENGRVIMRSSQPLVGPNNKRCKEDEQLINATLGIGRRGYIVDTRVQSAAKLAQGKGGGVEPEVHYSQWKRIHQPMERHKYLHESLIKFVEACCDGNSGSDKWLSRLESSGWLNNVKDVLTCACVVAQCVDKDNATVLVHGSEGIDTTLQVTSLAQLILDHDCRTVRGFEALVEREWLQAGHPFACRCAKSAFALTKKHYEAPVFLLFLDCVWQIWQQFPCSFEFNENFLILLFEHAYSSSFGTFLCNNENERKRYNLAEKTVSLWTYVNRPTVLEKYINPLYEPNQSVLWPSVAPQSLTVWNGLYLRWQTDPRPTQDAWEEIVKIKEKNKDLKMKATRLRRQLAILEKEALEAELIQPSAPQLHHIDNES